MSDFSRTVRRVAMLREAIKEYEDEIKTLLGSLGELAVDDYPAGEFILKVQPNRRFDPATAEQNLTPEEFALTLATKPDSATAKAKLSPERYAAAQKDNGTKMTIVRVTDG